MGNRLFDFFRNVLLGPPLPPPPAARLAESEALRIAREAAAARGERTHLLTQATRSLRDGRVVWTIRDSAVGNVLIVEVDDETGAVISLGRHGLR